jgi:hypothetical protein
VGYIYVEKMVQRNFVTQTKHRYIMYLYSISKEVQCKDLDSFARVNVLIHIQIYVLLTTYIRNRST